MSEMSIEPFTISIPDSDLIDLNRRLDLTRWPEKETVDDWTQGVPLRVIQDLCHYWRHEYDWRRCESWLNSVGQYKAQIDDYDIHFLHVRSKHEDALPMLLLHGWPGSVLEFRNVIGPLVDPTAHGGQAEDAFHLVIPSMPGYGFSSKPTTTGTSFARMAELFTSLMEQGLGYRRWVAQGGDWGADIVVALATANGSHKPPSTLAGVHMNFLFFDAAKELAESPNPTADEKHAVAKIHDFETHESGYFKEQATRPQTIGYALSDSPSAQAAWIYEKLHAWAERPGDCPIETVLSRDEILDNIMLYWLTNAGASSARLYWEAQVDDTALPIDIPVGVSMFKEEHAWMPRKWAERYYTNIVHWNNVDRGGHFAAWEVPDLFVKEMRDCFGKMR